MRGQRRRIPIEDGPPSMLYTVKQVELAIRRHLDDMLKPAGITALQYTALTVLWRRDGLTLTELAHNSFVTVQSMADLVRSLSRRDLITRRPDPDHGRRQLVSLTGAGRALLERYEQEAATLERTMLAALSAGESEELRRMLALCRRALS
ncbi:MarR family winged helix-turn-helix transcriptional regulator [Actinophytocola sp.]|uniref:MarR family winged helix-turn-helix transcriptional regulator n=1 Tax=Actinophytocola sp. TaxID=1872138 RepID=UPI002ED50943